MAKKSKFRIEIVNENIPQKNIGMILRLSGKPFPAGAIDLRGRDW